MEGVRGTDEIFPRSRRSHSCSPGCFFESCWSPIGSCQKRSRDCINTTEKRMGIRIGHLALAQRRRMPYNSILSGILMKEYGTTSKKSTPTGWKRFHGWRITVKRRPNPNQDILIQVSSIPLVGGNPRVLPIADPLEPKAVTSRDRLWHGAIPCGRTRRLSNPQTKRPGGNPFGLDGGYWFVTGHSGLRD